MFVAVHHYFWFFFSSPLIIWIKEGATWRGVKSDIMLRWVLIFFPFIALILFEVLVGILESICTTQAEQESWNYGECLTPCHKKGSRCTTVLTAICLTTMSTSSSCNDGNFPCFTLVLTEVWTCTHSYKDIKISLSISFVWCCMVVVFWFCFFSVPQKP